MSEIAETGVGHVTSTSTTKGKYLNPDLYEGIIEELYSDRSPLDLLHETCDKIGRDSSVDCKKKTGAIEVSARNQKKETEKRRLPIGRRRRSNQRSAIIGGGGRGEDRGDDVIVLDWCNASSAHGVCRSRGTAKTASVPQEADDDEEEEDEEEEEEEEEDASSSADDQPQDLRCWFREASPGGGGGGAASAPRCQATANAATPPSDRSAPPPPPSSASSSRSVGHQRKYHHGGHRVSAPLRPWPYARATSAKFPSPSPTPHASFPPSYYDADLLFTQYLELQYLAQASVLQEYLSSLQQLALTKAPTVVLRANCPLSSGGGGGGVTDEVKLVQFLPEAMANGAFLSPPPHPHPPHPQLRCEGVLGGAGGIVPLGIPYFGGGGGGGGGVGGHYQLPLFDHRLFVVEKMAPRPLPLPLPMEKMMRPSYEGGGGGGGGFLLSRHQQRTLEKRLGHHLLLHGPFYGETDPLHPTSPDTSSLSADPPPGRRHLTSPQSPQQTPWLRPRRRAEEDLRGRRRPSYTAAAMMATGPPPSSSAAADEILLLRRSLAASYDHLSRSFDHPTLLPSKKL